MAVRASASPPAAVATAAAKRGQRPGPLVLLDYGGLGGEVEDVVEGGLGVGGAAGEPGQEVGEAHPRDLVDNLADLRK
jgi:hypothetical protein